MTYRGNTNLFRIDKFFPYKSVWEVSKKTNQLDFTAQDIFLENVLKQLLERRGFFIPSILIFRFHNEIFIKLFFLKIKGYQKYIVRKRTRDLDYRYRKINKARLKVTNHLKKTQTLLLLNLISNNNFYKKYVKQHIFKYKPLQKQLKKIKKTNELSFTNIFNILYSNLLDSNKNITMNKQYLKSISNFKKYHVLTTNNLVKKNNNKNLFFTNKIKNISKVNGSKNKISLYKHKKDLTNLKLLSVIIKPLLNDLKNVINNKSLKKNNLNNIKTNYKNEYNIKNLYIYLILKTLNKNIKYNMTIFNDIIKNVKNKNLLIKLYNIIKKIENKNILTITNKNYHENLYIQLIKNYNNLKNVIVKKNLNLTNKYIYKTLLNCFIIYKNIYNKYWLLNILKQKTKNKLFSFDQLLQKYCGVSKIRFQYYHLKPVTSLISNKISSLFNNLTNFEKLIFYKFFKKNTNISINKKNFFNFTKWLQKIEILNITKKLPINNLIFFKNSLLIELKKHVLLNNLFQNTKLNKYKNEPYFKDLVKIFAQLFFNNKASNYLLIRFISFQFRILNRKKQRKFLTCIKRICEHFEIHPLLKSQFALKLRIKGRIGGRPRKKVFVIQTSKLFLTEKDNLIDSNTIQAYSRYGSYGISVWLRRTDLFSLYTKSIINKQELSYKNF